jgi:hypothetical protein
VRLVDAGVDNKLGVKIHKQARPLLNVSGVNPVENGAADSAARGFHINAEHRRFAILVESKGDTGTDVAAHSNNGDPHVSSSTPSPAI